MNNLIKLLIIPLACLLLIGSASFSAVTSAQAQQNISDQVELMRLFGEEEMRAVLDDIDANPEGLPVTVEVIAICEDVTYVYTATQGGIPSVGLTPTNVRQLPDTSSVSAPQSAFETVGESCGHTHPQSLVGETSGILIDDCIKSVNRCAGPCTTTPKHNFSDGLGIRLPMDHPGTTLSFSVTTSGEDTIPPTGSNNRILPGGAVFIYGGFSSIVPGVGEITTDMGLIYQTMYRTNTYAWKPCYLFKCGKAEISGPTSVEGQAFSSNGYIPGKTVDIEIRIDPVPSDPEASRVLLRTAGYAFHETSSGAGGETFLIQLSYSDFRSVKSPCDWRVLVTSVLPEDNGSGITHTYVYGDFFNIKLDGATPDFGMIDCRFGYFEKRGSGKFFMQVCRGYMEIKPGVGVFDT